MSATALIMEDASKTVTTHLGHITAVVIVDGHYQAMAKTAQVLIITSNKNIHFEMILDVGIGEKRKETRFLI